VKVQRGLFSEREIKDLIKAWLAISFVFANLMIGFSLSLNFYYAIIFSSLTVGVAFLGHELSHRTVARHYGCFAEFRSFDSMLVLAIAMSFFGFVFIAPGAVMISGPIGRRRNGKISMAGPLANLVLAGIFLSIQLVSGFSFSYGTYKNLPFTINSWLALFNLIPIWNFDGKKILAWNKYVYGSMAAVALAFMFIG
jgi:Zn-dependent protease